jgi:hypothetical protein
MARLAPSTLLCAALLAMPAARCVGQAAPATPQSPILNQTPAEKSAPETPRRSRAISGEAAAALAAATPKYTPPPPKPPPKPEEELVDAREVDKPKNTIVRLPKYIVQEKKPPVFRERDINTAKGLTDIAMRRYISDFDRALNRWTLPIFGTSKEKRALAMYAEDERLRNMSDLNDAGVNASKTDATAGAYILRESQKTYLRSSDFGWNGGGPK